ncbi:class I SAM-dependent methyltransferase [Streptomyces sp. Je 1-79]|uniref:class I SAM-dependent methyltransferase n=1 Tax=Streptomyces sp. Je 1-79 TaxID=2943847 RepID=UPI0021A73AAA|nr:class I SAM-dependent methyltransferase [Streptomyces sp. Je 1-79]MCT4357733.1 class I SAM-dependent methyltransferase [Streptomyces sp. Je 1-79]
MSAQQTYDEIGEAFEGFKGLPLAQYVEAPSFLRMVGDVEGKKVIDLACGTGFYSRELKRRGAAEVFGVDISGEMIGAAARIEQADPLGVRYEVGDVAGLSTAGDRYDVATAVMLLNYAETVPEFEQMCRRVHGTLKSGGEFFMLHQRPDYDFSGPSPRPYGFLTELTGEEAGTGPRVRVTALLEGAPISFTSGLARREVFETSLAKAGFSEITWVPTEVSPAGVAAYGDAFWADYRTNPAFEMLRCRA